MNDRRLGEAEALYAPRPADRLSAPDQWRHFGRRPTISGLLLEAAFVSAGRLFFRSWSVL